MLRFVCFLTLGAAVALTGCSGGKKGPKLAAVKGTVNLDGRPLPEGEISFAVVGEAPKTLDVRNGAYSGQVAEGKNKVGVFAYRMGPPQMMGGVKVGEGSKDNIIPARFNTESQIFKDVASSGANDFIIDVQSK